MVDENSSIEAARKQFQARLTILVCALVILTGAGWLSRPFYRHFKERRGQAQAQAFLAKGDYRSALLCARQVLLLDTTNAIACRVMAAVSDLSHNPATVDWLLRVAQSDPSVENKLQLAATALRYQSPPFPLTAQILDELAPVGTNLAGYQVTAASFALSLQRLSEAEAHFEIAAKLEPTNPLYELNLAVLRLAFTNEAKSAQARGGLEKFRSDANLGPVALRALIVDRLANHDAATAEIYSTQLLASARATFPDRLQQLGILHQLGRGDFADQLRSVREGAATNAPTVAQLAEWMQANGLVADEIHWLTNLPAAMRTQSAVRVALADAYLQSGDWRALHDFASQDDWDEMNFLRLALAARAWSQLGVQRSADSNWGSAISEAGNRYGALTTLLGLADRWKLANEREALLERIVEKFPNEPWAQEALEKLYLADGRTSDLRALYAKLSTAFPQNVGFKNNLAFTSLLLKTNVAQALQMAAENFSAATSAITASTYAYALHLQGRTKEGIAVMRQLSPQQLHEPDTALYFGALLKAAGEVERAKEFLASARGKTRWLPEEKELLTAAGKF